MSTSCETSCIYIPKIVKKNEIESAARKTGRVSSDKSEG